MEFVPSTDLFDDVSKHIDLLEKVDHTDSLRQESVLEEAIRRYVTLWLPLLVGYDGQSRISPPLDVHWIWYCHALSPLQYRKDVQKLVGKNVHHVWMSSRERLRAEEKAMSYWGEKYEAQPFHVILADEGKKPPSINLEEGSVAHHIVDRLKTSLLKNRHFYYQVSLPHFRDEHFIQKSVLRYIEFIEFRRSHPDCNVVPPTEIELVWRTHILSTETYMLDCTAWFGQVLDHSSTPGINADRDQPSPLPTLWTSEAVSGYSVVPGMWNRGESPVGRLFELSSKEKLAVSAKPCQISIEEIYLDCPDAKRTSKTLTTSVELTGLGENQSNSKCLEEFHGCHYDPKVKKPINFTLDPLRYGGISFVLTKKSGSFLKGQKIVSQSHTCNLIPMVETCPTDGTTFSETGQVSLNSVHLTVSARGTMTPIGRGPIHLTLIPSSGGTTLLSKNKDLQKTFLETGMSSRVQDTRQEIHVSKYRFLNRASRLVFSCTVSQKLPHLFLVQLYSQDKMVAEGHLIGADCLPPPGEVTEGIPCLDEGGFGFLIKNSHGDWGILTTNSRRIRNKNADRCAIGSIDMKLYTIAPVSKGWTAVKFQFPDENGRFRVEANGFTIDLKDGSINLLNSCSDVAEVVTLAYGVSSLYALSLALCKTSVVSREAGQSRPAETAPTASSWMKIASGKRLLCTIKL